MSSDDRRDLAVKIAWAIPVPSEERLIILYQYAKLDTYVEYLEELVTFLKNDRRLLMLACKNERR